MTKSRKNRTISQRNDNRKGKSYRAKRNINKEVTVLEAKAVSGIPWTECEQVWCDTCGSPHELVRPGKTQPTCVCDMICEMCGGRRANHCLGEDPKYPNMLGEWCPRCGPFGALNKEYLE